MNRTVNSKTAFDEQMSEKRPALWRGGVASIAELRDLQLSALKKQLGDKRIPMSRTLDGTAMVCYARFPKHKCAEAPLEAVEHGSVYVTQTPVRELGPGVERAADKLWEALQLRVKTSTVNLWVGGADTGAPLHFDTSGNVLLQAEGEKDVYFASPDAVHNFSFFDNTWAPRVVSAMAGKVEFEKVQLRPGDVLYLPTDWFHATRNRSASVMINYWFKENFIDVVSKLTVLQLAKGFSQLPSFALRGRNGASSEPEFLHERNLTILNTPEQKIAALLLDAKTAQEVTVALPGVRDRPPIGADLNRLRQLLPAMNNFIPSPLHQDLLRYFDHVARVIEAVLRGDFSFDLDLRELASISCALDVHSRNVAAAEMENTSLRVGWRELDEIRL